MQLSLISLSFEAGATETVALPMPKCLTRSLIRKSEPACQTALATYLDTLNHEKQRRKKERIFAALNKLADWAEIQEPPITNLMDVSQEDVEKYLETLPNSGTREKHRAGLRFAYRALIAEGILAANPVIKITPAARTDRTLPAVFLRLGDGAIEAMNAACPRWNSGHRREKSALYALRRFCKWVDEKHIYDLRDISIGDILEYRESIPSSATARQEIYLLRVIFEKLKEMKLIDENPCTVVFPKPAANDQAIISITRFVRRSGPKFEVALREFLNGKKEGAYSACATSLNRMVDWLEGGERIYSLQHVSPEHLLRFVVVGLANYTPNSRRTYILCIAQLFQRLCRSGLLKNDPTEIFFRNLYGRKVLKTGFGVLRDDGDSVVLSETVAKAPPLVKRAGGETTKIPRRVGYSKANLNNFTLANVLSLPYERRLALARFVRFIDSRKKPGNMRLSDQGSCMSHLTLGSQQIQPQDSHWAIYESAKAIQVIALERRFTAGFVDCYHAPGNELRNWAGGFVARHEQNMRLYVSHPGQILERPLEVLADQKVDFPVQKIA